MIKEIIRNSLSALGYTVQKSNVLAAFTMNGALARCAKRGLKAGTVIDVGASDGRWTIDCMKVFPDASYLLIEAQEPHKLHLDKLVREKSNVQYVIAAAGKSEGKIFFDNSALFGGLASEKPLDEQCIEVPMVTIDNEIEKRNLRPPYVIKLDTHGFEVPILEGARETIKQSSLIIVECYNYKVTSNSLRYFEMCSYMKELGFLTVELVDFVLRDHDSSFWQMDAFFIPSTSNEFKVNSFE